MRSILWTRYWLDAQGYYVFENILYQDNKVLFFWKITERLKAVSAQRTYTSDTILSRIVLKNMNSPYNGFPQHT